VISSSWIYIFAILSPFYQYCDDEEWAGQSSGVKTQLKHGCRGEAPEAAGIQSPLRLSPRTSRRAETQELGIGKKDKRDCFSASADRNDRLISEKFRKFKKGAYNRAKGWQSFT
jgi:hypothetical protein